MPRARNIPAGRERHKKVLKANKGAFHGRRKLYQQAKENLLRSLQYAYRDRKQRKRMMRRLWIARINAAARLSGMSYNRLIEGLRRANIEIDRKVLSDLAVTDPAAFAQIVGTAKTHLEQAAAAAAAGDAKADG